ncbi:MAG: hypothetical protein V1701_06945 [Planctomycetota bacterium]
MNKAISAILYTVFCILFLTPLVYANTGSGGTTTYYYRDNKLSSGVSGGTSDDFGYSWVEIIGKGGTQISFGSLPYYMDCLTDVNIPYTGREKNVINYYNWTGGVAGEYNYRFKIYRGGVIALGTNAYNNWTLNPMPEVIDNTSIPVVGTSYWDYLIYPYWDNLVQGADSWIGYRMDGVRPNRRLIITYYHMYHPNLAYAEGEEEERSVTFQVIIYEATSEIVFNYKDAKFEYWENGVKNEMSGISRGASATIGIEWDGSSNLPYSFNTASINNGSTILFSQRSYTINVMIPLNTNPSTPSPVTLVSTGSQIKRGSQLPFYRFSLKTQSSTAQWMNIRVDKLGSAQDSDIVSVDIYKDISGDGWDVGDTLLGSGTFTNGVCTITLSETINTTERYYFICLRLKDSMAGGATVGVRVRYRTYFNFAVTGNVGVLWDSNF